MKENWEETVIYKIEKGWTYVQKKMQQLEEQTNKPPDVKN